MLYEERLEAAERLRLAGNALFTAGDATGAMGKCAPLIAGLCGSCTATVPMPGASYSALGRCDAGAASGACVARSQVLGPWGIACGTGVRWRCHISARAPCFGRQGRTGHVQLKLGPVTACRRILFRVRTCSRCIFRRGA